MKRHAFLLVSRNEKNVKPDSSLETYSFWQFHYFLCLGTKYSILDGFLNSFFKYHTNPHIGLFSFAHQKHVIPHFFFGKEQDAIIFMDNFTNI